MHSAQTDAPHHHKPITTLVCLCGCDDVAGQIGVGKSERGEEEGRQSLEERNNEEKRAMHKTDTTQIKKKEAKRPETCGRVYRIHGMARSEMQQRADTELN